MSQNFSGEVRRGPRTNQLDLSCDLSQYPDPGFLDPDQDLDPGIFNEFLMKWPKEQFSRF